MDGPASALGGARLVDKERGRSRAAGDALRRGTGLAEIGSRLSERAELEKAGAIFAEIGARRDLARTTELLKAGVAD